MKYLPIRTEMHTCLWRAVCTLLAGALLPICLPAQPIEESSIPTPRDTQPIYSGDTIRVSVFEEPDLMTEQRVDDNGHVRLPLLGNLSIEGKTIREAEGMIERAYVEGRFLRAPQVTIFIVSHAQRQVSVFGQVRQPGAVTFPEGTRTMSIAEIISRAGGFTGIARSRSVRVTRLEPDGNETSFTINVDEIVSRGGSTVPESALIHPGDVIFVPERLF